MNWSRARSWDACSASWRDDDDDAWYSSDTSGGACFWDVSEELVTEEDARKRLREIRLENDASWMCVVEKAIDVETAIPHTRNQQAWEKPRRNMRILIASIIQKTLSVVSVWVRSGNAIVLGLTMNPSIYMTWMNGSVGGRRVDPSVRHANKYRKRDSYIGSLFLGMRFEWRGFSILLWSGFLLSGLCNNNYLSYYFSWENAAITWGISVCQWLIKFIVSGRLINN